MPWPRQTPSRRPGDWDCPNPSCRALVFASKTACFRCGTPPAPHQMHGYGMMSGGGMMGYGGGYVMGPMGGGGGSAQAMMGGMTYGMAMGGMHQAYPSYGMGGGPMAQGAMAAAYGWPAMPRALEVVVKGSSSSIRWEHSSSRRRWAGNSSTARQPATAVCRRCCCRRRRAGGGPRNGSFAGLGRGRLLRLLP